MIVHHGPSILGVDHNTLPTGRIDIAMTSEDRRTTIFLKATLAILIIERSSRDFRAANNNVVYLAFRSETSRSIGRVATHTHAVEHVVEVLFFPHNSTLSDSSSISTIAHHVVDTVVLLGPPAKSHEVVVREKLDLEDVVPEGAEGEVYGVFGRLLEDEWVDEVVLVG